jgi:NAD(P)-dependent dehydrogenase (short-subunit alcohol dehydrogenase family)
MDLGQWQNTLAVNLTGPFLLCKAYLQALREAPQPTKDPASIVFIGSTAGKFGEADHGDYAATKAALMVSSCGRDSAILWQCTDWVYRQYGLTPTLKNEIVAIASRARVNSVDPGRHRRILHAIQYTRLIFDL